MSRFFKKSGQSIAVRLKSLAPTESIMLELAETEDSFDPAMRCVSATATQTGIKITQIGLVCVNPEMSKIIKSIRVERVS